MSDFEVFCKYYLDIFYPPPQKKKNLPPFIITFPNEAWLLIQQETTWFLLNVLFIVPCLEVSVVCRDNEDLHGSICHKAHVFECAQADGRK